MNVLGYAQKIGQALMVPCCCLTSSGCTDGYWLLA